MESPRIWSTTKITTSFGLLESPNASFVLVLWTAVGARDPCAAIGSAAGSTRNNAIAAILLAPSKKLETPARIPNSSIRTSAVYHPNVTAWLDWPQYDSND